MRRPTESLLRGSGCTDGRIPGAFAVLGRDGADSKPVNPSYSDLKKRVNLPRSPDQIFLTRRG